MWIARCCSFLSKIILSANLSYCRSRLTFFYLNTSSELSGAACTCEWLLCIIEMQREGPREGTTAMRCKWVWYILDLIYFVQLRGISNVVLNWRKILTVVCHLVLLFHWSSTRSCKCSASSLELVPISLASFSGLKKYSRGRLKPGWFMFDCILDLCKQF